ncbi:hemophore-related protein [Mycobacterium angelicum]|uniref:Haemophore haem-binding domain-containing protein n=1 Tax=Mycobacterium angelicum TaxID=470074 RepID=A0A1W9Z9U5_MYCAN|nr:hypothetical protein [Mycobacterium angelicum]MCV7199943.1 hypothetical protein [Mycobacterium angelicum]ORA10101.1 hypothetical protein BST12_27015 [Mycobacterium angelicum]
MTLTAKICGLLAASTAAVAIAMPVASAAPGQCNTTFGQTASEQVQGYLDRHPDVKAELTARSQADGSNGNLIDYLNRHPDVRQALITLANQCTS